MHVHTVMGEQGEQKGAENTPLWGPRVEDQQSGGVVSYLHHLWSALQEVLDPVAQDGGQTHGPSLVMSSEGTMVLKAELLSMNSIVT